MVSRDDIVLGQPNINPTASIPLGNGALGVAAWAANGFTAQLNRSDTMPDRKSPGQVNIPGLSVISHAADFSGRLDLADGVLEESGGGESMKAWVSTAKDELIVDVSGANPNVAQTASINLWSGRNPTAAVSGKTGTLAETWVDNSEQEPSGQTFGSLSAITAGGRDVSASVVSPTKVQVSFKPNADGDFRVVVAAPHWAGGTATDTAAVTAAKVIGNDADAPEQALLGSQDRWWDSFWSHSGLVEMSSADGSAAYIENLRTLYLYEEAASEKAGHLPGQPGRRCRHVRLEQGHDRLDSVVVLDLELAGRDLGQHELGKLPAQRPDLRHVHQRPVQHRNLDEGEHGRPARCLRTGDHALQRQRR